MKKYSSAIRFLREKIKTHAAEGAAIRASIYKLTWKEGAEDALRTVRESKRPGDHTHHGKRFLKPYRRPETGNQRWHLWNDKRAAGWNTRYCLLAMGFLKDRPYRTLEPEGSSNPSISYLHDALQEAMGDNEALRAELTEERITDWLNATAKQEAA